MNKHHAIRGRHKPGPFYFLPTVEVKAKLSLCLTKHHPMKTYLGSGGISPRIPSPRH